RAHRGGRNWSPMHSRTPRSVEPRRNIGGGASGARTLGVRSTGLLACCLGGATLLSASRARADEPIKASEPTLMSEPGEVVDVVDAFDDKRDNPFDLHLTVGIAQRWESSKIRRESAIGLNGSADTSGFTHDIQNIATYSHSSTTLNLRADVGLYHDFGLFIRLPVILEDNRSLGDLNGSSGTTNGKGGAVQDTATGLPMFKVPFTSPSRSGVDYLAAGLRWAILSQQRDPTKPTWTVELEGRFSIGEPMHACNANPYALSDTPGALTAAGLKPNATDTYANCPTPGNTTSDSSYFYRKPASQDGGLTPGISRGTNAVRFGTMVSQRYKYVEPYAGFWFMAEFQKRGTALGDYQGLNGVINDHPPLQGGFAVGVMIHPYEHREEFQRLTIDLRFSATYVSQGRDYSELFDALGSSPATSLVAPNPAKYQLGADGKSSVGNYSQVVNFTGATDVEAHGIFGGSIGFVLQLNRMFRINGGFGMTYVQQHLITAADACNPNFTPSNGEQGRCQIIGSDASSSSITGAPNPNHRPIVDLPGQRFEVAETFIYDLWASASVMF
ncbi:MAG: hypothetical protein ACHREM_29205, partial [Polyangiales bacterium]